MVIMNQPYKMVFKANSGRVFIHHFAIFDDFTKLKKRIIKNSGFGCPIHHYSLAVLGYARKHIAHRAAEQACLKKITNGIG